MRTITSKAAGIRWLPYEDVGACSGLVERGFEATLAGAPRERRPSKNGSTERRKPGHGVATGAAPERICELDTAAAGTANRSRFTSAQPLGEKPRGGDVVTGKVEEVFVVGEEDDLGAGGEVGEDTKGGDGAGVVELD